MPHEAVQSRRLRRWLASFFLVLLSAFITYAVGEYLLLPRLPALMLGKWDVVEGQFAGSSVELLRDGTMLSTRKKNSATETIEGQVSVDGTTLWITTRDRSSGKETTDVLTVLELSPWQFVTQDESGEILMMRRRQ